MIGPEILHSVDQKSTSCIGQGCSFFWMGYSPFSQKEVVNNGKNAYR